MKLHRLIALATFLVLISPAVQARDLTVATWKSGLAPKPGEAKDWIRDCGQPFALDQATA